MLVLGFNGGFNTEEALAAWVEIQGHDASAALVEDGKVLFAIEEERLNRHKHSSRFPIRSIRACLKETGRSAKEVDEFAFYWNELDANRIVYKNAMISAKKYFSQLLSDSLGEQVPERKIKFVSHHQAHAMSAWHHSGFKESLIVTLDGAGDNNESGSVIKVTSGRTVTLKTIPEKNSLGFFYLNGIRWLGYTIHDEYKVMGLAPYGNPSRFRTHLKSCYRLLPDGEYECSRPPAVNGLIPIRKRGAPFTQIHKDYAAALQEALEKIVMHVLKHYQNKTGLRRLCLSGGVAHNCTMNGRILNSGLFDEVFVDPASHDAGTSIGAAICRQHQKRKLAPPSRILDVYLGRQIPADGGILAELKRWKSFVSFEKCADITERASQLLADGKILGWVQGRSEFGPRALGNRSILADPRPRKNRVIVNSMVKKREAYRPFAPSVLEEELHTYFETPASVASLPFMVFVVKVKEEKQKLLGAITHTDGTARVQSVSSSQNPLYWSLIKAFGDKTGTPILLNTSFNNNVEPIVDSVDDAIVSFLTTRLHFLVVGNYLVSRKSSKIPPHLKAIPSIPWYSVFSKNISARSGGVAGPSCSAAYLSNSGSRIASEISERAFQFLSLVDGTHTTGQILKQMRIPTKTEHQVVLNEVLELWEQRLISLRPS